MSLPLVTGVAPRWDATLATLVSSAGSVHLARRCADVAELAGVAAAGLARVALVSSDLRGLDRAVVDRLRDCGVAVLAVHPPGDEDAARRLRRWGLTVVLPADLTVEHLEEGVAALAAGPEASDHAGRDGDAALLRGRGGSAPLVEPPPGEAARSLPATGLPGAEASTDEDLDRELRSLVEQELAGRDGPDGSGGAPAAPSPADGEDLPGRREPGEVIVVWGAHGSAGRTTVAVNLAAELATALDPVLLVDADTYGASVAQLLSLLDEAPGLAAACRAADQGTLDDQRMARIAPEVRPGLRVLTGLPRPDRWPEVGESALADVLEQARALARWVVVDVAPPVEQDEELSFDTAAPRRNGATLTALQTADTVVVVGTGDPLGLQRLVRALDLLDEHSPAPRAVVVTRVRPGPVGPEPGRRIREALQRFAGVGDVLLVPEDREALDVAMLHGRTLLEARPGSPARQALRELAGRVGGGAARAAGGRARSRLLPSWRRRRG